MPSSHRYSAIHVLQNESGFLLEADAPSVDDSDEAILASFTAAAVADKPADTSGKGSFKNLSLAS